MHCSRKIEALVFLLANSMVVRQGMFFNYEKRRHARKCVIWPILGTSFSTNRRIKGLKGEKNRTFFISTSFSDVPYTNGCFPILAAITLKIPVLKVIPEPHSWPVPFYCRLLDTCLLIHLDIRSLARLFLVSTVPKRLIVAKVF